MIRMEIDGTIHPDQQVLYIKDDLFKILGKKITLVPNANAVLMFSRSTDYKIVIKSVELILEDLKSRMEGKK